MKARGFWFLLASMAAFVARAQAQPVTHPLWASTPNASWDAAARAQFEAAIARRGLGPLETVAPETPARARTSELVAEGMAALQASAYEKAATLLSDAAAQALATGGAGLSREQPASLFFHQAMALQLASGATYSEPFTTISPPAAKTAYLRAAVLGGGASLDAAASQPLVEASWRIAKALVAARRSCVLTINAHTRARVSVDGREFQSAPASASGLPSGEHFVTVEEPGHAPWSTMVDIGQPTNVVDVPATALLTYDGAAAVRHARDKGAAFALVGQLRLGDKIEIDLRLLDAQTGELRGSTAVPLAEAVDSPDLVASVLRLDEMAGRADLTRRTAGEDGKPRSLLPLAPPPSRAGPVDGPRFSNDTEGWLRQRWPLATAVGVAVGTALALGIVVAKDH